MKSRIVKPAFLVVLLPALAALLFACAHTQSLANRHPMEITGFPICSQCHTDWRAALDHTQDYGVRHKFYAQQNSQACTLCHSKAFCSDCHAHKEELKPSEKYTESPERFFPHRGDYLNQHKIDGRINPASCFPCHGRQNNERCKACHH